MKKITITESGRVAFIKGNNAQGVELFHYEKDGTWDPIKEGFAVDATKEEWDQWKKSPIKASFRNMLRRRRIQTLYKRGTNPERDQLLARLASKTD